jgi:hypothetical protein
MFRIECFVEDKKLGDALRSLMGVAIGTPKAIPVINAEVKQGAIKQQTNGSMVGMFANYLQQTKIQTIKPTEAKAWLKKHGLSPGSSNYLLRQACDQKLLRQHAKGNATYYTVEK